jgi:hypothetical protein
MSSEETNLGTQKNLRKMEKFSKRKNGSGKNFGVLK